MNYKTNSGRIVADHPTVVAAKEGESTKVLLLIALAIIGVMYLYDQAFAQKQQTNQQQEIKDLYWQWSYVPPSECQDAMAGDNRSDCARHLAKARADFEAEWARKVASGWVPPKWQNSQVSLLQR